MYHISVVWYSRASKYRLHSRFHGLYIEYSLSIRAHQSRRYPDGLAWQFNVAKKVVRKSPEFKKFHSFLVFETEVVSSYNVYQIMRNLAVPLGKHLQAGSS